MEKEQYVHVFIYGHIMVPLTVRPTVGSLSDHGREGVHFYIYCYGAVCYDAQPIGGSLGDH